MTTFTTQDRQDAERAPSTGDLRVNVDTDLSEIYDGGKWVPILEHNKPLTEEEIWKDINNVILDEDIQPTELNIQCRFNN